jgi:hypothetical protein
VCISSQFHDVVSSCDFATAVLPLLSCLVQDNAGELSLGIV